MSNCNSCIYYQRLEAFRNNPDENVGNCRNKPPRVFDRNIHEGQFHGVNRTYPIVHYNDWCGQFKEVSDDDK